MASEVKECCESLKRLSRVMAGLSLFGLCAVPLCTLGAYLVPDWPVWTGTVYPGIGECGQGILAVALPLRLGAAVLVLASDGFVMWALWELRALFRRYAQGEVFSLAALSHFNLIGVALFASEVMRIALRPVVSVILGLKTLAGPHHELVLNIGFSGSDAAMLFAAGVVLVIAKVMVRARRLAMENAGFV